MKKIISLITILILMTGCEATYNVEINNNEITENINIYTTNMSSINNPMSDYGDLSLKELFEMQNDNFYTAYYNDENYNPYEEEKQSNVKYYNQEIINTNNRYGINYNYKFTDEDYHRSRAVNTCYNSFTINKSNNIYSLSTNNLAKCFKNYSLLDKVTVTLKINNRVITHNADTTSNDTYTWIITKDNYNNKNIRLSYTTSTSNLEYDDPEKPTPGEDNPTKPDNPSTPNHDNKEEPSLYDLLLVVAVIGLFIIGIIGFIFYKGSTSKKY